MRASPFPAIAALALVALSLSGCAGDPPAPGEPATPTVLVTRPGDFAAGNASGAHLHDYWLGQERLVVMDGWPTEPGPGLAGGDSVPVYQYRPPSGHVVPQGTARVEVTFTWTPDPDDVYSDPELWVRTASDTAPSRVGPSPSGVLVAFNATNPQNDLPHQLLSAWVFEFRLSQRDDLQLLRFKANVTIHVEAVRGLEIPLYPGHPDRWEGRTEVTLVDTEHALAYLQDPGDAGCDGFSCPMVHVPAEGTIVPPDASHVTAVLTFASATPTDVGLAYHGAEGRSFQRLRPVAEDDRTKRYDIPVGAFGDGPYALASQWEFTTYIEGPVPDTLAYEEYHLLVTVHRHA